MAVNVVIALAYYLRLLVLSLSPGEPISEAAAAAGPRVAMGLGLAVLIATSLWPALLTTVLL
jgi:hypothetical protein